MRRLAITGSSFRLALPSLCLAVVLAACTSVDSGYSQEEVPGSSPSQTQENPLEDPLWNDPGGTSTTATTSIATSVVDATPEFDAFGAWWLVPNSTVVARAGEPVAVATYHDGRTERQVWKLAVTDVILGEFDGQSIQVTSPLDSPLDAIGEAIYFLVPLRLSWDTWSPDIWVPRFGELGIISNNLDQWQRVLPSAQMALGTIWREQHESLDSVEQAMHTEIVLTGQVQHVSDQTSILGAKYARLTLVDVELNWTTAGLTEEAEFGEVSPPTVIRVTQAQAAKAPEGSRATFFAAWSDFKGQADPALIPIGGLDGVELDPQRANEKVANLDAYRSQRDDRIRQLRTNAVAALRPALEEHGRIPLPTDPPAADGSLDDPSGEVFNSELVIQQADRTIIFDKWFFALLDGTTRVTVYDGDGDVLLEGPVEGEDAVMREVEGGNFEFIRDGQVVASITQDELMDAATQAENARS